MPASWCRAVPDPGEKRPDIFADPRLAERVLPPPTPEGTEKFEGRRLDPAQQSLRCHPLQREAAKDAQAEDPAIVVSIASPNFQNTRTSRLNRAVTGEPVSV